MKSQCCRLEDLQSSQALRLMKSSHFAKTTAAIFWSATSSYEVIADKLNTNFDGIRDAVTAMLSGEKIDVNVGKYKNTMKDFDSRDDVFTFLIHLGYLAYDCEKG